MSEPLIFQLGFPWETSDPFLFCVHHLDHFPAGNDNLGPDVPLTGRNLGNDFVLKDGWRMYHGQTVPGFPSHPHCGFETVTIVSRGYCDHADSLGAAARFGEGDAQWITTGSGLQHSEMFPLLNTKAENTLELFQIWLNLPRKSKFAAPHFSMLWKENIPVWRGNGATVTLVAGVFENVQAPTPPPDSWASDPLNDIHIGILKLDAGARLSIPPSLAGSSANFYLFEGDSISINGTLLKNNYGAKLVGQMAQLEAHSGPARLLWLQGKKINEPLARYGPFVMNEAHEIQQAIERFRLTQFGGWPWRHLDPVHDRDSGRFALFPDKSRITP
ncbi:MAG: hypothetical protein RLZZ241_1803 [Bacteroidota bacterium]|jgi:redox-sensitive bicupin YhaK (pirin superfamily)